MSRALVSSAQALAPALSLAASLMVAGSVRGQCSPSLLSSINTPDTAFDVAVQGTVAYIADEVSGLQIVDVSNPASPVLIGMINTPGAAFGIDVSGTVAYVADFAAGLQVVDVSTPSTPSILGTVDTPGFAQDVAVLGNRAYVADQFDGMHVIDVSDPANPAIIGSVLTPNRAMSLAVSGTMVYVADQLSGIQIIDVSDSLNPVIVGQVGSADRALGVAVSGTTVYGAVRNAGLQAIDASDPMNPVVLDTIPVTDRALGVAVSGSRAYVADALAGIKVVDISDPANLTLLGTAPTPGGDANRLAIWGTVAYVANFVGMRAIDVGLCFDLGACCVDGNCLDLLSETNCVAVGGKYSGDDSMCAALSCYPDECVDAITIADGDTPFTTVNATTSGPGLPPECDENPSDFQRDIWYRYLPTATGTLTISTCDQANFDTRVAVYSGDCGVLKLISCVDQGTGVCDLDTSLLEVEVTNGVPVLLRVGGNGPFVGTGVITLSLVECESDLDGNGVVNIIDLLRIITDWGPCP